MVDTGNINHLQTIVSQYQRIERLEAALQARDEEISRLTREIEMLTEHTEGELETAIVAFVEKNGRYPKKVGQLPSHLCVSECQLKKTIDQLKVRRRPRRPLLKAPETKSVDVETTIVFN